MGWIDQFRGKGQRPQSNRGEGARSDLDGLGNQARLVIEGRGSWVYAYPVAGAERITIGRSHENDIDLNDLHVSSAHAEIVNVDGKRVLRDLDSRNGTFLNRKKITESEIRHKDRIRIGATSMTLLCDGDASFAPAEPPSLTRMEPYFPDEGLEPEFPLETMGEEELRNQLQIARIRAQRLVMLLEFTRQLARSSSPLGMMTTAMNFIAVQLEAENGFIMQIDPKTEKWAVRARFGRVLDWLHSGEDESQIQLPMSLTIVEQVIQEGRPVVSHSAVEDPRFDGAKSVGALGIQSCLCFPLSYMDQALGVVYVDRRQSSIPFDDFQEAVFDDLASQLGSVLYPPAGVVL